MSKKVIGILGGMGPLATADLFQKITLHTVAACDQAHPRVCIDSNTDIADRTAALLHGGEDPVPEMIKSAKRLESIGADFLIMPCNTAHNYYEQVCEAVTIPVLHMIALTRDALKARGVKFGRPRKALPEGFGEVKARWERGELSARAAGKLLGVTHRSFLLWAQDDGCKEIVKKERTEMLG